MKKKELIEKLEGKINEFQKRIELIEKDDDGKISRNPQVIKLVIMLTSNKEALEATLQLIKGNPVQFTLF